MARSLRLCLLLGTTAALFSSTGCAPPCDRYCDTTAAYIDRCLAEGTTDAWVSAQGAGFGYWGYADSAEFSGDCKTDFDAQLAGAPDQDVLTQACEDEANDFALLEDRGACAELP